MDTADVLLAIDCGTQSLRVLLFDTRGVLLAKAQKRYPAYFSTRPGWAEQDAELFWQSLCACCQDMKQRFASVFNRVCGIGVTAQRDSLVNVNAQGKPLRPAITWLDQRRARQVYFPNLLMRGLYRLAGMHHALRRLQAEGACNWIMQQEPEIWRQTSKYLQVSGFLYYRLTGSFSDSIAAQIGHVPFDYKRKRWASPNSLPKRLFPVEKEKLAQLVPPGRVLGHVTARAAGETGLPEGLAVVACGSDKGCETLGMGVLSTNMASLSFGTTATVQTTSPRYFEPLRFMPPYPACIPGCYNPEVEIFRGYWMITWFKEEFAHKEVLEAEERNIPTEEVLNELLDKVPAGSLGLMVQPYWGPGLKHPMAKGAMLGFGGVHKKAHIYRAVIEGLAYALREGLERIERAGSFRARRLAVSGGASQSHSICQITADVFNRPLVRGRTCETAGLGTAILTAVGAGLYPDVISAVKEMVAYDKTFLPDPNTAEVYRQLYQQVYKRIFRRLNPLYRSIGHIINYPERLAVYKD